jgi:hypothetical protein
MDFSRLTNPDAYKQALAGLLRRGGEVTDYIATAPEKAGQAILQGHERNKALQAQAFANPNRPFQVTNQQAMAELGDRMLAGPLSVAPIGMIAYHGTPHLIKDKFDISKVGTGEGAQSYGYGMYFAESPEVAKTYRQQVVDANSLNANSGKSYNSIQDFFDDVAVDKGNLYKVDIPDEFIPKMIDWDKPFKQQPQDLQDIFAKVNPIAVSKKDPSNEFTRWLRLPSTSKELQEMGYKGIRYLDQASRGAKTGTSNFVVFDPTDVKILERNNQPISRKELIQQQIDKIE